MPREPAAFQARTPCSLLIEVKQTVLTKMLSGKNSLDTALVNAMPAARLTEVGQDSAPGCFPPTFAATKRSGKTSIPSV